MTLRRDVIWLTALTASACLWTEAQAAPRRSRTIEVVATQEVENGGAPYWLRLHGLEVRVRKRLPFGIHVTRGSGQVTWGVGAVSFRSRRWSGHDLLIRTEAGSASQRVRTVQGARLETLAFREDLVGVPGKRDTSHRHTLRPREPYPVHTGAAYGGLSNPLVAPNGLVVRHGEPAVRIVESRNEVSLPAGATVLDGLKAAAYVQACDTGLMRVEGPLALESFRGEHVVERADEALPEAEAFAEALSTYLYQWNLAFFVERAGYASKRETIRILDMHMALLQQLAQDPGAKPSAALLARQVTLGNTSAANVLSLLHDLTDFGDDSGLDPSIPVERVEVSTIELFQALQALDRASGPVTWRDLLQRFPQVGAAQGEAVIRMNGLDPEAPIQALGTPSATAEAPARARVSRSDLLRARQPVRPTLRPVGAR